MPTPGGHHLGGKLSPRDLRDHSYRAKLARPVLSRVPPVRGDLSVNAPRLLTQGPLGSCAAQAGVRRLQYMYPGFTGSRLATYYDGRALEGAISEDSGLYTRDLMKVLKAGVYSEDLWPYDTDRFTEPPPVGAPAYYIGSYSAITNEAEAIDCLSSGDPFIFAVMLPNSIEWGVTQATGILHPEGGDLGEHCMTAEGWDMNFRNSDVFKASGRLPEEVDDLMFKAGNWWGSDIFLNGYLWIPASLVFGIKGGDAWACHPPVPGSTATAHGAISNVPIVGHFV